MSVGNQTQAVDFDKQQLTLVLGENLDQGGDDMGSRNGTGKTTIVNALSYALYGVALTNIKRNNLINKTNNKGMLVTLTFEKDGTSYKVERGRSPNILKFFVNDQEQELIDESLHSAGPTDIFIHSSKFTLGEYYPWPVEARDSFTTIQRKEGCWAKHNYGETYEII